MSRDASWSSAKKISKVIGGVFNVCVRDIKHYRSQESGKVIPYLKIESIYPEVSFKSQIDVDELEALAKDVSRLVTAMRDWAVSVPDSLPVPPPPQLLKRPTALADDERQVPDSLHAEAYAACGIDSHWTPPLSDRELAVALLRWGTARQVQPRARWATQPLGHGAGVSQALLRAAGIDPDEVPESRLSYEVAEMLASALGYPEDHGYTVDELLERIAALADGLEQRETRADEIIDALNGLLDGALLPHASAQDVVMAVEIYANARRPRRRGAP